ncbi:hypothetical protein Tco_1388824 [Tanacetum coccineum]
MPKRKDTQVPQPSGPIEIVTDEAIHKELGDSLVRAATTASILEAEQDSGNITKTRSKATSNEAGSLGTSSCGGPRYHETIWDTTAQTRFENVSKHYNDSLLARGNIPQSDEDSLCTNLQQRVLDLEKIKTTQSNEIAIGLIDRVESSGDEEYLGEDASKQGRRINVIDADEDIIIVNVQDDADNEMFDVGALNGEEVFVAWQNENVIEKVVDAAQVSTDATNVTITTKEITLAQALEALKTSKPKDTGKGIMIEEPVKPMKKKVQFMLDEEVASKLQAEFDEEERLAREKTEEQEELSDAEKATLFQQLLEKRRKHFEAKRAEEKRNKPPTQAQQRKIMCTYLKKMEGKKLKGLMNKSFDSI